MNVLWESVLACKQSQPKHVGVGHDEYRKGHQAGVEAAANLMLELNIGGYGRLIAVKIREIK